VTSSANGEINDAIDRTWHGQLGGRGSNGDVVEALIDTMPEHLHDYMLRTALTSKVGAYFRRKNASGLAQAPEVAPDGTHAQLELLTEVEFRYVVARHVSAGKNEFRIARAFAKEAKQRLGVEIDLRNPEQRESGAA
jgi:hypothetical protein